MDTETIDSGSPKCLICYCSLKSSQFANQNYQHCNKIFNVYCRLLRIQLLGSMQWNFLKDALPFCDKCLISIEEISVLYDQLENIQGLINDVVQRTLEEIFKGRNCQGPGLNTGTVATRSNVGLVRNDHFRFLALKRYNPRVDISRRKLSSRSYKIKKVRQSKKQLESQHQVDDETESDLIPEALVKIVHEDTSGSPVLQSNCQPNIESGTGIQIDVTNEDHNDADFACSEFGSESDGAEEDSALEDSVRVKTKRKLGYCDESKDVVSNESKDPENKDVISNESKDQKDCGPSKKSKLKTVKASPKRRFKRKTPQKAKKRKRSKKNSKDSGSEDDKKRTDSGNKSIYTSDGRQFFGGVEIKKIDGVFQCGACEKSYKFRGSITNHVRESHRDGIRKLECRHCGKIFTALSKLRDHELIHGEKNNICELCGVGFKHKSYLLNHQQRLHNNIRNIQCEHCDKKFFCATECKRHARIHTGEKPYECKTSGCGKRFANHSCLKKHTQSHGGLRTFKCTQCNRAFIHHSSLGRHVKTTHRNKQARTESPEYPLPKKSNAEKSIQEQGFQDLIRLNSTSFIQQHKETDKSKDLLCNQPEANLNLVHDNSSTGDAMETEQNNVPTNLSLHSFNPDVNRTADSHQIVTFQPNLEFQGQQHQYQYHPLYYGLYGPTSSVGAVPEQPAAFSHQTPYSNINVSNNSYSH